jgi:hypothetical protein
MQALVEIVAANIDLAALAILVIFVPFFLLLTLRARQGHRFSLRPIAFYERARQLVAQAAESGRGLHLGLGASQLGSATTPESLAGATVLSFVARHAAMYDQRTVATVGDGTLLGLAQGVLQRSRQEAGFPEHYAGRDVRFYGQDRLAFALGTAETQRNEGFLGSVLVGPLEAEGLWIGERGEQGRQALLGASSDPAAAALLDLAMDASLVGEDVYAAGAYLHKPAHLGSLAAQDFMRVILILAIIAGVVFKSLGYWG